MIWTLRTLGGKIVRSTVRLKQQAVLVLDRHVFHGAVPFLVRRAVVLGLDDDRDKAAQSVGHAHHMVCKAVVPPLTAYITDEHRKNATRVQRFDAPNEASLQCSNELLEHVDGAQVGDVVAVPDDVPVRRMDPDHVVPPGQRRGQEVESLIEVGRPVGSIVQTKLSQASNDISRCS